MLLRFLQRAVARGGRQNYGCRCRKYATHSERFLLTAVPLELTTARPAGTTEKSHLLTTNMKHTILLLLINRRNSYS